MASALNFSKHALASGSLHLVVKMSWILGMEPALQHAVGLQGYGDYAAAMGITVMFTALLDPGINTMFIQRAAGNPKWIPTLLPSFLRLRLFSALLYILVLGGMAYLFEWETRSLWMVGLVAIASICINTAQFLRGIWSIKGRYTFESVLANLDKIIMMILGGVWLLFPAAPKWAEGMALIMLISAILSLVVTGWSVLPHLGQWNNKAPFHVVTLLKKAGPFALMILLMGILYRFDAIWLKTMTDPSGMQNGIYGSAFRFFDAFMQFISLFMVILMPMLARQMASGQPTQRLTQMAFVFIGMLGLGASLLTYAGAPWICAQLYPQHASDIAPTFRWISMSLMPLGLSLFFGAWLTAAGQLKKIHWAMGLGVGLSILGNVYLQPKLGALGAAQVCLATQWLTAILQGGMVWQGLQKEKQRVTVI
jgi:O-antigen/teichoic acid export membrane protein